MGTARESWLALLAAGLGLLAAWRGVAFEPDPLGLRCAPTQVGRAGERAVCGGAGALSSGERRVLGLPIDVNAASAEDFEALPGVGPRLAARIVEFRRAHGPFARLDDLEQVPGIGPGKLRLLDGRAAVLGEPRGTEARYTRASR